MNLEDWKIVKGVGRPPVLYHWHGGKWKYWCDKSKNRDWYCTSCDELAPKEIAFAADLCKCNWDVLGSILKSLEKVPTIYGMSHSTFPKVKR